MRLLLDENVSGHSLAEELRCAGHHVETVTATLGPGTSDLAIAAAALSGGHVVLTRDCDDFRVIYGRLSEHPGLLLVYGFEGKALASGALAGAVANVARTYPSLQNMILTLNDFFW